MNAISFSLHCSTFLLLLLLSFKWFFLLNFRDVFIVIYYVCEANGCRSQRKLNLLFFTSFCCCTCVVVCVCCVSKNGVCHDYSLIAIFLQLILVLFCLYHKSVYRIVSGGIAVKSIYLFGLTMAKRLVFRKKERKNHKIERLNIAVHFFGNELHFPPSFGVGIKLTGPTHKTKLELK